MDKFIRAGDSVVINMIQFAISMGFTNIYLYGVDLDWDGPVLTTDYDRPVNLHKISPASRQRSSFIEIKRFAEKRGVSIVNVGSSENGLKGVFPYQRIDDLLDNEFLTESDVI